MKEDGSNEWKLKHVVIADYKHSTIMEMQQAPDGNLGECDITRFTQSLNLISNLMSENWIPRVDSTTSYLGIQCIPEILNENFHAFQTISSDDVLWDVYFNVKTL